MVNFAVKHLKSAWKGPAFTLYVDGLTEVIGQGEVKATVTIKNPSVMKGILTNPSLAIGEAYMEGDLQIEGDLLSLLEGFYSTGQALSNASILKKLKSISKMIPKKVPRDAAIQNARHHYDIGNDFYKLWLDSSMAYTCAYYANENDDLHTAQIQKFDLVCRKARLEPGQTIVDLGCGWGGLIFHAVEKFGVTATGVVAAKEQAAYIEAEAKRRGLQDEVKVQCTDWRDAIGSYDRVVSVGMLEHVGFKQYPEFYSLVNKLLKEDGIAFVHSIGRMKPHPVSADPWISKYIFPGHYVPALEHVVHYPAAAGLHIVDVENLWQHYTKTLTHWVENYEKHRAEIIKMYDAKFDRMWWLYLMGSIAAFKWGGLELYQTVMTKNKQVKWPLQREVGVGK
ncbi:MAG: class I SAM-dependent methyltransferase [Candidatus Andersenbacteria bacterium]|nr:class I SAM-dependent methyltransferase [Candidatus Andersenbacteria bacterium]